MAISQRTEENGGGVQSPRPDETREPPSPVVRVAYAPISAFSKYFNLGAEEGRSPAILPELPSIDTVNKAATKRVHLILLDSTPPCAAPWPVSYCYSCSCSTYPAVRSVLSPSPAPQNPYKMVRDAS